MGCVVEPPVWLEVPPVYVEAPVVDDAGPVGEPEELPEVVEVSVWAVADPVAVWVVAIEELPEFVEELGP